MDRYDSFEKYFETKINIFDNAKYCLFNHDDKFLNERFKSNDKNIIPFSVRKEKEITTMIEIKFFQMKIVYQLI